MDEPLLPAVEIEPQGPVRGAVIWLHGLGADGHDFEPVMPMLGLVDRGVRCILPHAPSIPVTINGGWIMPAWYDIRSLDFDDRGDAEGILTSTRHIEALVARERERGVPSERIVLGGFSQGGAIAVHTALRHGERLAAVVALSTYLVRGKELAAEASAANRAIDVFQGHGTQDPMVPIAAGRALREVLETQGHRVTWREYPIPHAVSPEEIADVAEFLSGRF
jgi:phospholipase/carboxylesterase